MKNGLCIRQRNFGITASGDSGKIENISEGKRAKFDEGKSTCGAIGIMTNVDSL